MDVPQNAKSKKVILAKEFHRFVTNAEMGSYILERLVMLDLRRDVSLIVWARWTGMTVFLGMRPLHQFAQSVSRLSNQSS